MAGLGTRAAAALVALVALMGCGPKDAERTAEARIRIKVTVDEAVRRTMYRKRVYAGVLEAYQKADLAPLAPGKVRRLLCKVGDRVAGGQTLVRMDDVELVAAIAHFQPLKGRYRRSQGLLANGAVSKVEFEAVEGEYLGLKRRVEQLQENTTIAAPFAGVVTHVAAQEGELYSPQMMPAPGQASGLIQLARLDPLKIDLNVDDRTVALVTKKMPVVVTTDVLPDTSFSGEVEYVNPLANPASRTFQVRVIVRNTGGLLKAGYFAEVGVLIDHRDSVLTVPAAAVVGGKVFVVRDSVATALPVVTGWEEDGFVEIRSGLSGESAVIVGGNKALPDTARVEVVKAEDGNG